MFNEPKLKCVRCGLPLPLHDPDEVKYWSDSYCGVRAQHRGEGCLQALRIGLECKEAANSNLTYELNLVLDRVARLEDRTKTLEERLDGIDHTNNDDAHRE